MQEQGYKLKNQEIEEWKKEKESYDEKLESKWNLILSKIEDLEPIHNSIESLDQEITNKGEKLKSRVEAHNANDVNILSRIQILNSREERWKERLDRHNANIDTINRSSARLTSQAEYSIEQERIYLIQEQKLINTEKGTIRSLLKDWQEEDEHIDAERAKFNDKIDTFNQKIDQRNHLRMSIQELLKERNQFAKNAQDEINFWREFLIAFENELESLDEKINTRIEEMNGYLQEIRSRLSANYFDQFDSPEDAINELQEVVNRCLDQLSMFRYQIFTFHQELNNCIFRVNINKMVMKVLQKTTEHYFDETGQFEYRGSHYHFFRQHGVTLGLALTTITLMGFEGEYEDFYNALLHKVESLGHFPEHPVESQILNFLNSKIDLLFDSDFDRFLQNGFKIA